MKIEPLQEEEYNFPYHHLVDIRPFSEARHLFWGYKYAGYLEKILASLGATSFTSLVDIGCGDGKILKEIAHRFPDKRLVGLDYSEKSLRFARAFSSQLTFADQTEEQFDAFVMIEVIEHIDPAHMQEFLNGVCKNLKPGALGVLTSPCDNTPVLPKHFQHFSRASLTKTIESHFEVVSFEYTGAKTTGSEIIQRLLANRFFILNYQPLIQYLYQLYCRKYLVASAENATQVYAVIKKK